MVETNKLKFANLTVTVLSAILFIGCNSFKTSKVNGDANKAAERIIILGLDGLSVTGYKTVKHPNIDSLMVNGVLSLDTRAVMPSVTLPNWTSHLTGSGPKQHGVDSNSWTLEKHSLPAIAQDSEGYYPSIFKILKDKVVNVKTAYYYNWPELINTINKKYLDEVNFQENDKYMGNYNMAVKFAEKHKKDPILIFLYSVHTDHEGHKHNWMSPEYVTAIEEADKAIGELVENLKSKGLYNDTHFLLITDHGGKGGGHGGMSPEEMNVPWAITGPGIQKGKLLQEPNNNINTAVVILRLFNITEKPKPWVGEVPESVFE